MFDDDFTESYGLHYGNGEMNVSLNFDAQTLDEVAERIVIFLKSAGFDYVEGITLWTTGGNEVTVGV